MLRPILIAGSAALTLAACTAQQRGTEPVDLADDSSIEITGPAQDCVSITSIGNSDIVDDRTIDFEVAGKTYRNRLTHHCPGLKSANSFTYETSQTRLCSTDIIYVLQNYGGTPQRGAGCGLGDFTPIQKVQG